MRKNIYKNAIKLISGGIDSYIMSREYPEGKNIYIDFGQPYKKEEVAALNSLGVDYEIITIGHQQRIGEGVYIPDRNLTMAAIITMIYNPPVILMAGLRDDNCADKTEAEFEKMSEILSRYAGHNINVISPYWKESKGELIERFCRDNNGDILKKTFSCYAPKENGEPCGNCPACLRRVVALETNNIKTGVRLSEQIIDNYLSKIHLYDKDRFSRFFIYLRQNGGVEAIDIDGVIAEEKGEYKNRRFLGPLPPKEKKYRVLYTSRLESDRQETESWLKKHGVIYDALIMNKLPYDKIVDDKLCTISQKEWK